METILILAPLLAGIIALAYTITANLMRVWLNHRIKLALLEKFQHDPSSAHSLEDLREMAHSGSVLRAARFDHVVLGATLAAIGLCSALASWLLGGREWMTGAYFGGVLCVASGLILVLLGAVVRYLEKLPAGSWRKDRGRR